MADENAPDEKPAFKADHKPPDGAETTAVWTGGGAPIEYTASAKWLGLPQQENPAGEIVFVSDLTDPSRDARPGGVGFTGGAPSGTCIFPLRAVVPPRGC